MQYSQHIYFTEELMPKDDVDKLFEKLQQLEPPPSLISKILKTVSSMTPPRRPDDMPRPEGFPWNESDGLVVRKEHNPPC